MKYYWIILIIVMIAIIAFILSIIINKSILYYQDSKYTNIREALKIYENQNKFCVLEPSKDKIIGFKWDGAGFNNSRMSMEIIFGLALIYNRTIVIPPPGKWAHIPGNSDVTDFYDYEALKTTFPIITSTDFFGKNISYKDYCSYFEKNNGLGSKQQLENADPTKCNISCLKLLADKAEDSPVWFFNMRMFGNMDKYFDDTEFLVMIRKKIFQGFKFKRNVLGKVAHYLKRAGITKLGSYNAIHYRAGDFKQFRKHFFTTNPKNYIEKIKNIFGKNATSTPLIVVTNETSPKELLWLTNNFNVTIIDCSKESQKEQPLIDMIACTAANKFIGTTHSTFSYYIQILRGYMSKMVGSQIVSDEPYFLQINSEKEIVKKADDVWSKKSDGGGWGNLDVNRWKTIDVPTLE